MNGPDGKPWSPVLMPSGEHLIKIWTNGERWDPSWWSFLDELELRDKCWHISEGDVVLDIGAGQGSYTLSALAQGASMVHAWDPDTQWLLTNNVALNGWSSRFEYHPFSLWHETDDKKRYALDQVHDFERIDWIKIDTEGAEEAILKGAMRNIERCSPRILLENHYHVDNDCEWRCGDLLKTLGYSREFTRPHGSISHSLYVPISGCSK